MGEKKQILFRYVEEEQKDKFSELYKLQHGHYGKINPALIDALKIAAEIIPIVEKQIIKKQKKDKSRSAFNRPDYVSSWNLKNELPEFLQDLKKRYQ